MNDGISESLRERLERLPSTGTCALPIRWLVYLLNDNCGFAQRSLVLLAGQWPGGKSPSGVLPRVIAIDESAELIA
jgi:hypothetical protein